MKHPDADDQRMLWQADDYCKQGDVYNAVKLYKRVIRGNPEWIAPYLRLAKLYKDRLEWKATAHYNKKAVALDPSRQEQWWDLSIAATALGKRRLANRIWRKFDFTTQQRQLVSLQVQHSGLFELLWAEPISPVQAVVRSIPHPDSGVRFRDTVLYDQVTVGYQVVENRRIAVLPTLDVHKSQHYDTYSCYLYGVTSEDITTLEKLAVDARIGMEIWSNARQAISVGAKSEFYTPNGSVDGEVPVQVGLAARRQKQVQELLNNWQVISLKEAANLQKHT